MISVCLASDRNYLQHLLVTMSSVLTSANAQDEFSFIILTDGSLTIEDFSFLKAYGKASIELIDAERLMGGNIRVDPNQKWPLSAFYRLLLPFVCPDHSKVIYLDCDIIVRASLSSLWAMPLDSNLVAGVADSGYPHKSRLLQQGIELEDEYYINSGVTVWNLDGIRSVDYRRMVEDASDRLPRPAFADQCWINIMFDGQKKTLPVVWNVMSHLFAEGVNSAPYEQKELRAALNEPSICHFTNVKPWTMSYTEHPYWVEYWKVLKQTPFKQSAWKGSLKKMFFAKESGFFFRFVRPIIKPIIGKG